LLAIVHVKVYELTNSLFTGLNIVWVGWVGTEVAEEDREELSQLLLREHRCVAIFFSKQIVDESYHGSISL
jgi:trehalose-6-phosphate synthase